MVHALSNKYNLVFYVQNYCIEPEQLLGEVISEKDIELAITVTSSSEQRQRIRLKYEA